MWELVVAGSTHVCCLRASDSPDTPAGFAGVRQVTTCGLPVVGWLFSPPLLFAVWAIGAVKFWAGYKKTMYTDNLATKMALTAAWCAHAQACSFVQARRTAAFMCLHAVRQRRQPRHATCTEAAQIY